MDAAYEDGALRELTSADRADLSRRLTTIGTELDAGLTGGHQARELFITITAGASLLLIPWIAVLPILLPATRGVSDWREIWVGFDVVLAIMLAATAVLAFLKRQSVVLVAFVTATLLVCDAWFDTMTSAPGWDRLISLGSTILELTLALILFNTARLFFHFTAHSSSTPDAGRISELFGRPRQTLGLPDRQAAPVPLSLRQRRGARRGPNGPRPSHGSGAREEISYEIASSSNEIPLAAVVLHGAIRPDGAGGGEEV